MSMKKAALTVFAGLLLTSVSAQAQPPSTESVEKLLAATQSDKVLDVLFANMDQMMRQSMNAAAKKQKLSEQQQHVLDALPQKLVQTMREEMSWDKLRPLYLQIYQESFTQEDIDGLTAFYESPTGRVFVEKMPGVVHKTAVLMQSRMVPLMQKMQAIVAEAVNEAKQSGP